MVRCCKCLGKIQQTPGTYQSDPQPPVYEGNPEPYLHFGVPGVCSFRGLLEFS